LLGCFAALALLVAMATGASAQAAGTRICPDNLGSTCGTPYLTGTVFKGTGSINLGGVIACSGSSSSIELEITAMGSGDELTEIFALTGSNCTGPVLGTCSVRAIHGPWSAPVHVLGTGPNGTAKATATGSPGLKIFGCSSGLGCEYVAPTGVPAIEESITGGKLAIFKASGPTMERIGGSTGCSALAGLAMVHEVGPVAGGGFYVRT
jgi:hypothetical protein